MKLRSFAIKGAAILSFLAAARLFAQVPTGSPATSPEYFSANKAFSGEVAGGADNNLLVTVFKRDGESKTHFWSRKLELDSENQSFVPTELRMTVTDDGKTAILRHGYAVYDRPALHVVTATVQPLEIYMDELLEKLPADVADLDEETELNGRLFEVLIESPAPPVYGLWFQHANKWVALALDKPALSLASGDLEKRLQAAGLAKARDLARQHQPGALQRVLLPLRQAVQGNFQGFANPNPSAYIDEDTATAYRFLTSQRVPEDRKFIDALAAKPLVETLLFSTRQVGPHTPFQSGPTLHFAHSQARRLGDELIALWDNKPKPREDSDTDSIEEQVLGKPSLFASISGQVRLPFPARPESGVVNIYLIPDALPKGQWRAEDEVVKISARRMGGGVPFGPARTKPGPSQYGFGFGTLDPGAYRLKAVWDHRPPHFPARESDGAAEAGDYETVESAPFQLAAGERKRDVILECTNRVGDAPAFFKDDEKWLAENPPKYEDLGAPAFNNPYRRRKVLQSFSLRESVLKTNSLARPFRLLRMNILEQPDWNTGERARCVSIKFLHPARRGARQDANLSGKITDEHGCAVEGNASSSSGRFTEVYFNTFPFAARTFRFELVETEYNQNGGEPRVETVASFNLTNAVRLQPENLSPARLPARRELPGISVELASLEPEPADPARSFGGPRQPFLPEVRFWEGGQQSSAWRVEQVLWRDRWGNQSQNPNAFCREERVLKLVARVARDAQLAQFSPEETWTVPIEKVPGPGESLPLNLKKEWMGVRLELLAIGGPGEFTYDDGKNTAAAKQITTPNRARRYQGGYPRGANARQQEPKIYFKNASGFPMGMPGQERPMEIVARTPHLVYRATTLQNDARYAILDELEIAENEGPRYYGPPFARTVGEIYFGALSHRPGQAGASIAIVAQQAREAEFVVDRPPSR